ncbi:MAG: DsbA family protein [Chthoniobacterales bacterium]
MKRYLPFALILLVAAVACTAGVMILRHQKTVLAAAERAQVEEASFGKRGANPPHIRGNARAPVTLEEFGDFQCPPCGNLSSVLAKLEHDYGARLRVIFRQYPLQMHAHAAEAARVAEAAGMQDKFWEMHDLLYRNQTSWTKAADPTAELNGYAGNLGLDPERFKTDLASKTAKERIEADQARADSLGVDSTPTVYLNHNRVTPSAFNEKGLRAVIDAALGGKAPASPSPTK